MENVFIKNIHIDSVRHLKNIDINISDNECKHIIFTGKNGSGKTSLIEALSKYIEYVSNNKSEESRNVLDINFNITEAEIYNKFNSGEIIFAYYQADRVFKTEEVKNVEKINLNDKYSIYEKPSSKFVKYLVDMKVTQALSLTGNKREKAEQIGNCLYLLKIF